MRRLATVSVLILICSAIIFAQRSASVGTAQSPVVLLSGVATRSLAVDAQATLYLSTFSLPNRVFALNSSDRLGVPIPIAALEGVAGIDQAGSLGDGGSALDAQLDLKTDSLVMRSGIAVAPDNTIFIADTRNATIRRIAGKDSSEPGIIRSVAGRWGPRQDVSLAEPMGIALDRAGNLYIADHGASAVVVLRGATGSFEGTLETIAHVVSPASVAVTLDGSKVFVASPEIGAVFAINTQSHAIQTVPGFPQKGSQVPSKRSLGDQTGSQVTDETSLDEPIASGQAQGGTPTANPCNTEPAAAQEPCPSALAVDGKGNLFVADAIANQIVRIDAKTGKTSIAAGSLSLPGQIVFDAQGTLYLAEQGRSRLVAYQSLGQTQGTLTVAFPAALPPPPAPRVCPAPGSGTPADAFNFCDQPVGGTTASQSFTLTNNSTSAVTGLVFNSFTGADTSDFTVTGSSCVRTLASGASCMINVAFVPQATGSRNATLGVADSAGDSATADVTGTGDDYELTPAKTQSPGVSITPTGAILAAVEQGKSLTIDLQATPDSAFGGTVTFACPPYNFASSNPATGLPQYTTCTVSSTSATLSPGGQAATFQVALQTAYQASPPTVGLMLGVPPARGESPHWPLRVPAFPALAAIAVLAAIALLRRRAVPLLSRPAPVFLTLAMAAALLGGCHHSTTNPKVVTTPLGTYTITIQGTAQNASRGVTITLTVLAHQ